MDEDSGDKGITFFRSGDLFHVVKSIYIVGNIP